MATYKTGKADAGCDVQGSLNVVAAPGVVPADVGDFAHEFFGTLIATEMVDGRA
jgi:hypothetical protein